MAKKKEQFTVTLSDFAENFFYLGSNPFSLDDYPHMRRIYNTDARKVVMKFSRQCVLDTQIIELANGKPIAAKHLKKDDPIIGIDKKHNAVKTHIKNIWDNGVQPCYRITTRSGHEATVTNNHPFLTINGWTNAEDLEEKQRIAVSKNNSCSLPETKKVEDWKFIIAAHLLAEGGLTGGGIRYSNQNKTYAKELQKALKNIHPKITLKPLGIKYPGQYRVNGIGMGKVNPAIQFCKDIGIYNKNSQEKEHPDFIWDLNESQIKDYLRIWWNTDGSISSRNKGNKIYIAISLISKRLIKGLQTLLLKLGIPSRIYDEKPKVYENTNKDVYTLEVIGQEGKKTFLEKIDTDRAPLNYNFTETNGKPFFYPKEIYGIYKEAGAKGKTFHKRKNEISLPKLRNMNKEFPVEKITDILEGDFYYDEISSVEYIGEHSTTGVEIEKTKTFLIDHIATHNTAKSTTLANILLARALIHSDFKQLYTSPAVAQTQEFSRDKLEPVIKNSPLIKENFVDPYMVQNVFKKQFKNHSVINLRYALLNADRIRGVSADVNCFDEVQDLRKDVIGVIEETMSRSLVKKSIYAGTPKRTKGTLADYWFGSTQNEFAIKCEACNHWNILDQENIGLNHLICSKCGNHLDLRKCKGQWVSTYSNMNEAPSVEGYRVCLLHFAHSPWVNWQDDVIYKMENQSTALFHNETLGLEYDSGAIPITKAEVIGACNGDYRMSPEPDKHATGRPTIMGIDYGPVNSESSHTCLSIVQEREGKLQVVYAKKFLGKEADYSFIHEEVPKLFKKWNCSLLASDYGMGEAPNSEFRNRLGLEKVWPFQHLASQKEPVRYNPKMRAYTMNKNFVMNKFFTLLKNGKLRLPHFEDVEHLTQDIRNVIVEYDEDKNKEKYTNVGPDDFVHATLFASMALMMLTDNLRENLQ